VSIIKTPVSNSRAMLMCGLVQAERAVTSTKRIIKNVWSIKMTETNVGEKMIGYCGLICTECPAYLATKANDEKKANETAELWTKHYGIDIKVEDVWCDGCLVDGKKCGHCGVCEIRACAVEKGVKNCGHCDDYSCEKLDGYLKMIPDARIVLDMERKGR
jgi:Protein of unknown function (DUF3795)